MLPARYCHFLQTQGGWDGVGVWEARKLTGVGDVHPRPVPGEVSSVQPHGDLRRDAALPGRFHSRW